ncbi:glycerol-3-phosphate 1-O-acyltransferase PlsY [Tissierella sp.]|uniref:glycerol-3-phosphate 1-O-acyltransferase PlsY n=1 Tax=Tissierella sp. TaxID=41274 RepID=UPI002858853F|nr:glycerol-3-phosphate 1-O-acyltransferase PlsY [Tissierella sp.]MDR7856413.1 glycerol-3-phosphate 1-O-acyltransferase PlsY [Tissierella sp.]
MKVFITILISYLIGCFSSAYFLGKISKNIDIRSHGSGNAGATNALRVLGTKMGILTFVLDILKGIVAVMLGKYIYGFNGGLLASVFVVLGHNFPVFLGFKGGKGVATSLGVLLILNWQTALISLVIAVIFILTTKYVSLGSIMASLVAPIAIFIVSDSSNKLLFITTLVLASLSIIRHKANIMRLFKGKEAKLGNKI